MARGFYKIFGITLLNGISLTFKHISLYLGPDFPSGIRFIKELISDNTYGDFQTASHTDHNVLLDVGANVGLLSLNRCLNDANLRAYCFEPHPETFSLLRVNVELNQLSNHITIYNYAISDHVGTAAIVANSQNNMAKTIESDELPIPDAIRVTCWTLDALCSAQNIKPTFLKIDVEGHELAVLTGAKNILNNISEVIVECHSEQLASACGHLLADRGLIVSNNSGLLLGRRTK